MKCSSTDRIQRLFTTATFVGWIAIILVSLFPIVSYGATAKEIDSGVDTALTRFTKEVKGARELLQKAKGVLVFPKVIKAGLGVGGEYGEGALRIGGETVDYYSTAAGSVGFQVGGQLKIVIICFMKDDVLNHFRKSAGWKAGVDGSVAMAKLGAGKSVDTNTMKEPIAGFIFGQQGLMLNATLEGAKFTKLKR